MAEPEKHSQEPDLALAMSGEAWAKIYLSQLTPGELVESGALEVDGEATEAIRVLNLFDRCKPEKAVVIPPAYGEQRFLEGENV